VTAPPTKPAAPDLPTTTPSPGAPPRRLDASMTLLAEVMQRPLDPGYALAARRREAGVRPSRPARVLVALAAAVCGLVTTWAVVELRQPQPGGVAARKALESEIQRRTQQADAAQHANDVLRAQLAAAQSRSLAGAGDPDLARRLEQLAALSGEVAVTGPGLEVTLQDAPSSGPSPVAGDPRQDAGGELGRVLDRDVQIVVNGLWAAGAEAVAVNGQRLSSLSAIRSAGQAIFVDRRPLVPPYVIQAIGDPARLQTGLARDMAGPYLQALRDNYNVQTSIQTSPRLALPAAASVILLSARTQGQTGSASGTASSTGSGTSSGSSSGTGSSAGPSVASRPTPGSSASTGPIAGTPASSEVAP